MSLGVCLPQLREQGKISEAQYQRLAPVYQRLAAQMEARHGRAAAEAMATQQAMAEFDLDLLHKKRVALLQLDTQRSWLERQRAIAGEGKPLSDTGAADEIRAMEYHREGVANQAFAMMSAMLEKHRRNLIGTVRDKSDLINVLGELFGRDSGSLNAREMADAWRKTSEWLRSRFNAAGGRIGKLEGWMVPQSHDMRLVRDAGFPAWRGFILPLLDRAKMMDRETGLAMDDGQLEGMLRNIWDTIATDGWARNNPGTKYMSSVANRGAEHRVLHFETPEGWLAYAEKFGGKATVFDTMVAHVHAMARDIAAMEKLGPNPAAALRWQQGWLEKSGAEFLALGERTKPGALSRAVQGTEADRVTAGARGGSAKIEKLWNEYSGVNARSENPRMSLGFAALSGLQVSAKLGSAVIASAADFFTVIKTAAFNDLPVAKMLLRYTQLMLPDMIAGGHRTRMQIARLGLISEEWTRLTGSQHRLTGEELTHEFSRRLATGVIKASLLARHTEALQLAFGMETMSAIVHQRGTAFDNLDGGFARMLKRYGIDAARWDKLGAAPLREEHGAEWLYPEDVSDGGLADDLMRMLATEGQHAVVAPDLDTRALVGQLGRGSLASEVGRSMFWFKSFPMSMISLHGRRMMRQAGIGSKVKYGLSLIALTTMGGAISEQLGALRQGQDPEDMTDPAFWGRALLKGGGLGIFGDLLKSSENRVGGGWGQTLVGPLLGQTAGNITGMLTSNTSAAFDGDPDTETQWSKDAVRTLLPETPGLSLWYVRLALDRLLLDQLREWADPDFSDSYRRMNRQAAEKGTRYFAPPGERGAMRAPDWSNAIGQPDPANIDPMEETIQ